MDTVSSTFVGQSAVGAVGPQMPTAGLFGTGGEFAAAQTLSTTSALSTGVGAFSAYSAGQSAASGYAIQAGSYELQAKSIELNAKERSNILRKQLLADIGAATASAGARGIDVGTGSPREIVEESISTVRSDISTIEAGGVIDAAGSRTSAAASRISGSTARLAGALRATQGIVGYGLSRAL